MAGRGIDFEHKFKTSRWAEDLLLKSLSAQAGLLAVRFGLSQVKASADVTYDKNSWKEPDLLVYRIADFDGAGTEIFGSRRSFNWKPRKNAPAWRTPLRRGQGICCHRSGILSLQGKRDEGRFWSGNCRTMGTTAVEKRQAAHRPKHLG